jgi:hypothetical protein
MLRRARETLLFAVSRENPLVPAKAGTQFCRTEQAIWIPLSRE